MEHADPKASSSGLIGARATPTHQDSRLYTPHNSGADLYPYLILTAHLTDPEPYNGRLLEMLRNEIRYTTVLESIPTNLEMSTGAPALPACSVQANTQRTDFLLSPNISGARRGFTAQWT